MGINIKVTDEQMDEFLNIEEVTNILDSVVNNWLVEEDTGTEDALIPEGINKMNEFREGGKTYELIRVLPRK